MTPRARIEATCKRLGLGRDGSPMTIATLVTACEAAVAAERELCASLCEATADAIRDHGNGVGITSLHRAAADIRARGSHV